MQSQHVPTGSKRVQNYLSPEKENEILSRFSPRIRQFILYDSIGNIDIMSLAEAYRQYGEANVFFGLVKHQAEMTYLAYGEEHPQTTYTRPKWS